MFKYKKRIIIYAIILSILFAISLLTNIYITNSKYVVRVNKKSFAIENVDKEPPTVDGVPDEDKPINEDVIVDYDDNDQVVSAKIWYNPTKKEFTGPGEDYDKNTTYTEEGWYHTEVIDRTGNKTEKTWLIDKTPPVVIGVSDGDIKNTDITISNYTDNLSGVKNVLISKDGSIEQGLPKNTTLTESGHYIIVATDKAGNIRNINFIIDKIPPTVTGVPDEDNPTKDDVTVDYDDNNVVESAKIWYNPTKKEFTGPGEDYNKNTVYKQEGWYHTEVIDTAGNKTEKTWLIDKTPPVVVGVKNGDLKNTDITISDYSDNLSGVKKVVISKNGGTATEISKNTTLTDTADYKLTAIDNAGNITIINFGIDKEPPKVLGVPDEGQGTTDDVTVDYTDNKGVASAKIWHNPTEKSFTGEGADYNRNTVYTEEGWYHTVVIDIAGNKTERTWYIDKSAPVVTYRYIKKGTQISNAQIRTTSEINELKCSSNIINTKESQENSQGKFLVTGGSIMVGNETEFRNAINNGYSTIITKNGITFSNPITISSSITVQPTSSENSINYSGYGSFITVASGGRLDLNSIVVYTNGTGANHNLTSINIQNGGTVIFDSNSIVDGGSGNTGILVNSGGTLYFNSCHIANSTKGVVAKGNSTIMFGNLNNGRCSEFWSNTTAISFEDYTGTSNFNQSNIKIRNNTNGIVFASGTGTVNISSGEYYSNSSNGIVCTAGNTNISGGTIYSNGNGILQRNGTLNISGGNIYYNNYGINLESGWSGKMTITNINLYSNYQYSVLHNQNYDGNCTILGGSINGVIYLGKSDNYVNTNGSYPTITVTPSSYYANRKLVRTNSNDIAKNENEKVTMTANGSWYKYVNNEYIVIGEDGKVIVKHVDTSGTVITTETIKGRIGESYSTEAKTLPGYDLISTPSNATGTFTQADIIVEYQYDISNCVVVNYQDVLSGVASAKYWFNASSNTFSGEGTDFADGTIFEDYGFYKVIAINGLGLQREVEFELNSDSFNNSSSRSNSRMLMSLSMRNIEDEYILPFNTDIENIVVTSEYGYRVNPITGKYSKHTGIDLTVIGSENEEVISIGDGIVSKVYLEDSVWGNAVEIEHTKLDGTKIYSFYAHLKEDSILLEEGVEVLQGQIIGIMGTTGNSTGIHLHFEIRTASGFGNDIDPTPYILGRESLGIIDTKEIEIDIENEDVTEDEDMNSQEEVTGTNDETQIKETNEKELPNEEQNTDDKNVENTNEAQNTTESESTLDKIDGEVTNEEIVETEQVQEESEINNEVFTEESEIINENTISEAIELVTETID